MAAELDKLRKQTQQVAEQFRRNGHDDVADILDSNARYYGAYAKAGRSNGLPENFPDNLAPQDVRPKETAPTIDLRKQTYETLSRLRVPTPEERKALESRGQVFLPVDSRSYAQVVAQDPEYFWRDELEYANRHRALKEHSIPGSAEIGLDPYELAIPDSFGKSQKKQLAMVEARSEILQVDFPDARMIMLPVALYAQADLAYKAIKDEVLFKDHHARGLDMLWGAVAADAGRVDPSRRFLVRGWNALSGSVAVGAVPAVVFVNNQDLAS